MDPFFNFCYLSKRRCAIAFYTITFFLLGSFNNIHAQAPTITLFSPTTVCQGNTVTITGANFTGATNVKLGTLDAASFVVNSDISITATVANLSATGTVIVITPAGTVASSSTLTILQAPIPLLTHANATDAPFTNCNSASLSYLLTVANSSSNTAAGDQYKIDWGDNTTPFNQANWPAGAQTSHTYASQGYFNITFTITPSNGCTRTITYNFYNGTNPLASFTTTNPTTGLCAPADVEFQIGNWFNNSPGTTYQLNFGDGSPLVTLPHPLNGNNTIRLISHTYTTTSCPNNNDYTAVLKATNGCFTTTYTLNQIIIRKKPTANFTIPSATACINSPVCFNNTSINGYGGNSCLATTTYLWDFGDGTTSTAQNPPCHTYTSGGTYTVTLTASNTACGSDVKTGTVTVLPASPPPVITANPVTYCQGQPAVPLTATGTGLLWYTAATGGTGNPTAPTPPTTIAQTLNYYVSQTLSGSCESPRVQVTVVINPTPARPAVTTPVQLCVNQAAAPLTATGANLLWYATATGGTGSSTAPTPSTASVGSTTYYVSQTVNGCEGPRASIVVNVNSLATAPAVTSPVNYCQNQTATPLTAVGTGLLWYTVSTGGTGSAPAPIPITSAVGSTTYYVSQTTGCGEGPRAAIVVNVSAGPSASIAYPNTNLCNFLSTPSAPNPPVAVTLTGTPGGVYSITPASGLPIVASTGTINPSGAVPGTYTIKYTVTGNGCPDFTTTTTVTISGSPSATLTYPPGVCTSTPVVNAQLTGSQGGNFTSTAGLTINPSTGAITPGTSTPGTYTITYTIVANAPCPQFSTSATVTITQAPSASIGYGTTNLCNILNTPSSPNPPVPVSLTGTPGGNFSITPAGLPIDAITGTITPSGAAAGTYTIKYTIPAANGCPDFIATASVTISGTPSASIAYPSALCTSSAAAGVQLSGTQGGSFTSSAGLTINATTGLITPATSTPGTYTVTYTILPSAPCPGFTTTTNITITQAPSATIGYGTANLCNILNTPSSPNPPVPVSLTGTQGGSYTISPATGLPINAAGTINPSGATQGTYTVTYTLPAAGGCPVVTSSTSVTISAAPFATIAYAASPYCNGITALQAASLTGTAGGTFSAPSGLSINAATGAINPSLSTPGIYTVTYTITPSSPCPGYSATASVEIVASPVINFPVSSQSICSGNTAVYQPVSTIPNTTYNWLVTQPLPPNVAGITSGTVSGPNPSIALSFTNTGTLSQTITVQVRPVNPAQNPCAGVPVNLTLTINPIPAAPIAPDTVHFCMGTPATPLAVNALPGNTVKWYDQNLAPLNAAPLVSTSTAGQFTFYASQSNASGCESPKVKIIVVVHPTPKIISSSFIHPTSCGLPSGSITLDVLDLNNNPIPNVAVVVHYNRFQTAFSVASITNANGKIIIPLSAGTYTGLYVEIHGCASQTLPDVFVLKDPNPPAQPVAGYNPPICSEAVLNLTAASPTSSQTGVLQYVWAGPAFGPAGDTVTSSTVTFPSANVSYAGTYVVYAIQNNCISLPASFPVVIKQSPSKPIITANTPLCVGSTLTLQAHSSISVSDPTLNYVWRGPGTGFPVNSPNAGINSVTIRDAGRYSITATSPMTGCSSVSDTLIQIGNYPIIKFATDTLVLPTGAIVTLSPQVVNAGIPNVLPMKKYDWTPVQDIACTDSICSSVKATAKNNICYSVKATNIYGCSGSTSVCVQVFCKGSQVFIPNAFLPRGDLPENTRFMIRGSGIKSVKSFRIFNRWGKVVFERNNFPPNVAEFGWDGKVNGKMADQGVYVYTLEVICENGTPYFLKGNVTLL